jgi:hypothetical protein
LFDEGTLKKKKSILTKIEEEEKEERGSLHTIEERMRLIEKN